MVESELTAKSFPKLPILLEKLEQSQGPFVIVARAHSGTRALAEAFTLNQIFMGANISRNFLDSEDWWYRFTLPLITSNFFPNWQDYWSHKTFRQQLEFYLSDTLSNFFEGVETINPKLVWGWKISESIFLMPIIKKYFPRAKFIHLIRDGRDVVLSDNGYFHLTDCRLATTLLEKWQEEIKKIIGVNTINFYDRQNKKFCLNVTFNTYKIRQWQGIDLFSSQDLIKNKYKIQMHSWMNYVETGRKYGRQFKDSYYEFKYEDFCRNPVEEITKVFSFLDVKVQPEMLTSLKNRLHQQSIGKWKQVNFNATEYEDFMNALEWGKPLLKELGYV